MLEDHGLTAWPKTSGSRGFHIYARIERRWPFKFVRLAAQTVAREVERRAPDLATGRWWKEEREGVFVDFNQNAIRPHRRLGVLGAGHARRPGVDAAALGRGRRLPARGVHHRHRARALRRARRPVGGHGRRTPARWTRCSTSPTGWDRPRRRRKGAKKDSGNGRRRISTMPLIEIARTKTKDEAMAALDDWRGRYPSVAEKLEPADVLVDGMRGPSSIWYRIRINLQHVPEDQRPPQEPLLADYNPWENYSGPQWMRRR